MSKLILPNIEPPTEDEYATFQRAVGGIDESISALRRLARIRNDRRFEVIAELILTTKEHLYKLAGDGGHRGR